MTVFVSLEKMEKNFKNEKSKTANGSCGFAFLIYLNSDPAREKQAQALATPKWGCRISEGFAATPYIHIIISVILFKRKFIQLLEVKEFC